jgi:hypothetical protein
MATAAYTVDKDAMPLYPGKIAEEPHQHSNALLAAFTLWHLHRNRRKIPIHN